MGKVCRNLSIWYVFASRIKERKRRQCFFVLQQQDGSIMTVSTDVSEDVADIVLKGDERVAHYKGILVWLKTHHASMVMSKKEDHMQMKMVNHVLASCYVTYQL